MDAHGPSKPEDGVRIPASAIALGPDGRKGLGFSSDHRVSDCWASQKTTHVPVQRAHTITTSQEAAKYGLSEPTVRKAKRLVEHNRVQIVDHDPNRFYVFKVYGTEQSYECYLRYDRRGIAHYSCNSDNNGWSCVFSNKNRHQPYCAHTLAAHLLLRRDRILDYDEELFLEWQDALVRYGPSSEQAKTLFEQASVRGRIQMMSRANAWNQENHTKTFI